jgi:phage terminase large subunit-like protein
MKQTPDDITTQWIRTPNDKLAVEQGCYFDLVAAQRVRDFFKRFLRHGTGEWAGQPFELLDWQWQYVIAPLFGWKQPSGLRRFNRAYISTPKKNGKTALMSGVSLYMLIADGEHGAEIYSAAGDRDQAALVFKEAAKMVEMSPSLRRLCRVKDSTKTIVGKSRSFYRALSAEHKTKEGINASCVIFDELHTQPGRELWDTLRYAGIARRQPLHLVITTSGSDHETVCGEQYTYAKRVQSGEIEDTSFLTYIAEASMDDPWDQESTWEKANPSWGITIKADQFRADFNEARESPAKEASFRRYRLNQWVNTAHSWLSMERWDACSSIIDVASLQGQPCWAGLDLSATDDTTALVLAFPQDDESIILLPTFYLPKDNIHKLERKHKVSYRAWAKVGHLTLTPGNVVDYAHIRRDLRELAQRYDIQRLAIDRKFQGQQLELDLMENGFDVGPAGQGWRSQDLPAKELERLIQAGKINHGGHPVLRWHASNAVVDIDKASNYSLNKKLARSKVDGIAAIMMALSLHLAAPIKPFSSTYSDPVWNTDDFDQPQSESSSPRRFQSVYVNWAEGEQ